jgi:hypothetical protein
MTTVTDRIRSMLTTIGSAFGPSPETFESIIRDIVREEIRFADAAERERRQKLLEDMRAGRPVDAFVNRGDMDT